MLNELRYGIPFALRFAIGILTSRINAISLNITDECQLDCVGCYWRSADRIGEQTDAEILAFLRKKRDEGVMHLTIVGGEPYLRADLLEEATQIIPSNWIVSNGEIPLRRFARTTNLISIDGVESTHNEIRRRFRQTGSAKNLYRAIQKNLQTARARWPGKFPVVIHTTLSARNYLEIEAILRQWHTNGLTDAVLFSLLTPVDGADNPLGDLDKRQREWIVGELLRQKRRYGSFLANTTEMIRHLHPDSTRTQTPENCGTAQLVHSFDAKGRRIPQCILGPGAKCSGCGCVITSLMAEMTMLPRSEARAMQGKLFTVVP